MVLSPPPVHGAVLPEFASSGARWECLIRCASWIGCIEAKRGTAHQTVGLSLDLPVAQVFGMQLTDDKEMCFGDR